jgi:hypothetical protein
MEIELFSLVFFRHNNLLLLNPLALFWNTSSVNTDLFLTAMSLFYLTAISTSPYVAYYITSASVSLFSSAVTSVTKYGCSKVYEFVRNRIADEAREEHERRQKLMNAYAELRPDERYQLWRFGCRHFAPPGGGDGPGIGGDGCYLSDSSSYFCNSSFCYGAVPPLHHYHHYHHYQQQQYYQTPVVSGSIWSPIPASLSLESISSMVEIEVAEETNTSRATDEKENEKQALPNRQQNHPRRRRPRAMSCSGEQRAFCNECLPMLRAKSYSETDLLAPAFDDTASDTDDIDDTDIRVSTLRTERLKDEVTGSNNSRPSSSLMDSMVNMDDPDLLDAFDDAFSVTMEEVSVGDSSSSSSSTDSVESAGSVFSWFAVGGAG